MTRSISLVRTSPKPIKQHSALQQSCTPSTFPIKSSARDNSRSSLMEKILIYRIQIPDSGLAAECSGSSRCFLQGYFLGPHTHLALIGRGGRSRLCFGGFCIWLLFFCCHGSGAGKWDLWVLEGENECAASKGSSCHWEENHAERKTWKKNKIFSLAVKKILSMHKSEIGQSAGCQKPAWKPLFIICWATQQYFRPSDLLMCKTKNSSHSLWSLLGKLFPNTSTAQ